MVEYRRCLRFPPLSPGRIRWSRSGLSASSATPTEPQEQGWPQILAGRTTLISAPTGSGKTLAAFLTCIDRLVRKALAGDLHDRTEVLYVSPLKALGNDIQKNLEGPLGEILADGGRARLADARNSHRRAHRRHADARAARDAEAAAAYSGDHAGVALHPADRRKSRAILRDVETVIVDEIHAVADDKRGAHLALSLERLWSAAAAQLVPPVRIGLRPRKSPSRRSRISSPAAGGPTRPSSISGTGASSISPSKSRRSELGPIATNEMWGEIYDRIAELVRAASLDAGLCQYAAAGRTCRAPSGASASAKTTSPRITAVCRASCASPPNAS